jgi:hypothetical protein
MKQSSDTSNAPPFFGFQYSGPEALPSPRKMRLGGLPLTGYLLGLGLLLTGCPSGGGYTSPPGTADFAMEETPDFAGVDLTGVDLAKPDLAMPPQDLAGQDLAGADMTSQPDLAVPADMSMPADMSGGGSCSPSTYRCGPMNSVQICNSTGTAWLHSTTCAVSCAMGLCTGGCTPKVKRCNANAVEECNTTGTAWNPVETCTATCYSGACTLAALDVTASRNMDGEVVVVGDVIIRSGVTVSVPSGQLTVRARSITVEAGATINVTAKGDSPEGRGGVDSRYSDQSGGGGGYGTQGSRGGSTGANNPGGPAFGQDTDIDVVDGSPGGNANDVPNGGGSGGAGGGVLRLIADTSIAHAGTIVATGLPGGNFRVSRKGGGGGGSGGGVLLLAGTTLSATGIINTAGGAGGTSYFAEPGGAGGSGRIKLIAAQTTAATGTFTGKVTKGYLPPITITSSSHPEPARIYNDGLDRLELSWNNPVPSRQGYYTQVDTNFSYVPGPGMGTFLMTESQSLPATAVRAGDNYFHIVTVDPMFMPGKVENRFQVRINSTPVSLSSSSHPSQASYYASADPFVAWTLPVSDADTRGVYYVLDHFGDTVPTKTDTFIPLPQKQLVRAGVADGIWFFHVVAEDTRGYLTKQAAHYRVNIGMNPGTGVALGQVTDMAGKPVDGAEVSISRGLQTQSTTATGNYNFPMVPAGSYELRVRKAGYMTATKMITITKGGSTNTGVVLN